LIIDQSQRTIILRSCLEIPLSRQAIQHQACHGDVNPGFVSTCETFIAFAETAKRSAIQSPDDRYNRHRPKSCTVSVLYTGGGHHNGHEPSQGIDQNMALAAIDQFSRIETAYPGHRATLDALTVQAPCRGMFVTSAFLPHSGVQQVVQPRPGSIAGPTPEIVIHRRPRRKLAGQLPPFMPSGTGNRSSGYTK
jgi:hypothetical protein